MYNIIIDEDSSISVFDDVSNDDIPVHTINDVLKFLDRCHIIVYKDFSLTDKIPAWK